jgi:cytidine deaminase
MKISDGVFVGASPFENLSDVEKYMFELAKRCRANAQAPYSNYLVGSAVLSASGQVYGGCNVERVSYSETAHAENNAIDSMVASEGSAKIEKIVVIGAMRYIEILIPPSSSDVPMNISKNDILLPCGRCRQIIWENCCGDSSVPILSLHKNGCVIYTAIGDAFPMAFGPEDLGIKY